MFISHDLKVVRALATDLIVMRDGKICRLSPEEIAKLPPVVEPDPQAEKPGA